MEGNFKLITFDRTKMKMEKWRTMSHFIR